MYLSVYSNVRMAESNMESAMQASFSDAVVVHRFWENGRRVIIEWGSNGRE